MSVQREKRPKSGVRRAIAPLFCADSVILRGNEGATVYGCRRIVRYDKDRVCLSIGKHCVCVRGKDLICTSFSAGAVTVEGEISWVRFCQSGCAGTCADGDGGEI